MILFKNNFKINNKRKLLKIKFRQRLTAKEALNHDFFWTRPHPSESLKCLETSKEQKLKCLETSHKQKRVETSKEHKQKCLEISHKPKCKEFLNEHNHSCLQQDNQQLKV